MTSDWYMCICMPCHMSNTETTEYHWLFLVLSNVFLSISYSNRLLLIIICIDLSCTEIISHNTGWIKLAFLFLILALSVLKTKTDTYSHALWHCSPVFGLQSLKLSSILVCRIPLSPHLCLPCDKTSISFPTKHAKPTLTTLAIAKKIILINWKNKHLPSVESP